MKFGFRAAALSLAPPSSLLGFSGSCSAAATQVAAGDDEFTLLLTPTFFMALDFVTQRAEIRCWDGRGEGGHDRERGYVGRATSHRLHRHGRGALSPNRARRRSCSWVESRLSHVARRRPLQLRVRRKAGLAKHARAVFGPGARSATEKPAEVAGGPQAKVPATMGLNRRIGNEWPTTPSELFVVNL